MACCRRFLHISEMLVCKWFNSITNQCLSRFGCPLSPFLVHLFPCNFIYILLCYYLLPYRPYVPRRMKRIKCAIT